MHSPGLIVQKVGMTRVQDADGKVYPVTLLSVPNQKITKILNADRDGYTALQVGYYEKQERNLTKSDIGRLRKSSIQENFARFLELRTEGPAEDSVAIGAKLTVALFDGVASVDVTGITKGKGTQGAVRRFGAAVGRMTHGSRFHRRPGSLGCRTTPGRVFKNKHQPGHMGDDQATIQNLKVVDIDQELNLIALKGSVPGHRDGYLLIQPSVKAKG